MKKIAKLLPFFAVIFALCFALSACGGSKTQEDGGNSTPGGNSTSDGNPDEGNTSTSDGTSSPDDTSDFHATDAAHGVTVQGGGLDVKAELVVSEITDEQKVNEIKSKISDKDYNKDESITILDISVVKDNSEVQPNGKVKITVPAPNEYWAEYIVYHITDTSVEQLEATVKDGMLSFETESFSYFVVTEALAAYSGNGLDGYYEATIEGAKIGWFFEGNKWTAYQNGRIVNADGTLLTGTFIIEKGHALTIRAGGDEDYAVIYIFDDRITLDGVEFLRTELKEDSGDPPDGPIDPPEDPEDPPEDPTEDDDSNEQGYVGIKLGAYYGFAERSGSGVSETGYNFHGKVVEVWKDGEMVEEGTYELTRDSIVMNLSGGIVVQNIQLPDDAKLDRGVYEFITIADKVYHLTNPTGGDFTGTLLNGSYFLNDDPTETPCYIFSGNTVEVLSNGTTAAVLEYEIIGKWIFLSDGNAYPFELDETFGIEEIIFRGYRYRWAWWES